MWLFRLQSHIEENRVYLNVAYKATLRKTQKYPTRFAWNPTGRPPAAPLQHPGDSLGFPGVPKRAPSDPTRPPSDPTRPHQIPHGSMWDLMARCGIRWGRVGSDGVPERAPSDPTRPHQIPHVGSDGGMWDLMAPCGI